MGYTPAAPLPGPDLRFAEMYRDLRGTPAKGTGAAEGSHSKSDAAERERLRKACQDFESIFLAYLLKAMRATVPRGGVFGDSRAEEYFTSLLDERLAEEMARRGGVGLAEILYRDLQSSRSVRGAGEPR